LARGLLRSTMIFLALKSAGVWSLNTPDLATQREGTS
jgi:hypothetical protein